MAPTGRYHSQKIPTKSEPIVPFPLNNAAGAVRLADACGSSYRKSAGGAGKRRNRRTNLRKQHRSAHLLARAAALFRKSLTKWIVPN
ncbi:MAG: hypothetical protein AABX13_00530 [Nanoarchaeota archaeon]